MDSEESIKKERKAELLEYKAVILSIESRKNTLIGNTE
jgi:hypothetical protein